MMWLLSFLMISIALRTFNASYTLLCTFLKSTLYKVKCYTNSNYLLHKTVCKALIFHLLFMFLLSLAFPLLSLIQSYLKTPVFYLFSFQSNSILLLLNLAVKTSLYLLHQTLPLSLNILSFFHLSLPFIEFYLDYPNQLPSHS
jgi:hypothetical protein